MPQRQSENYFVQVPLNYAKVFAVGRMQLQVVLRKKLEEAVIRCFPALRLLFRTRLVRGRGVSYAASGYL